MPTVCPPWVRVLPLCEVRTARECVSAHRIDAMRIQINVDVAEHEIELATELLSVLRSITDEVNVRTQKGVNGATAAKHPRHAIHPSSTVTSGRSNTVPASASHQRSNSGGSASSAAQKVATPGSSAASTGTALPPGFPPSLSKANGASLKQSGSRPGSSGSQVGSMPGTRAAHAASADASSPSSGPTAAARDGGRPPAPRAEDASGPAPAPSGPGPVSQESTTAPAKRGGGAGGEAAAPARPSAPSREDIVAALRKLIEGLDTEDNYELCLDKVADNLRTVFENGNLGEGDEAEAFSRFWDAFRSILWDPHRLQAQKSVVPFMNLLPRLPKDILSKTKEPLISQTMRRLTESRPVDTSRQELFTDAEIFACIATFRLVAASGAVKTIIQMLGPEQKRAAAVTMLGKTVERCADQLIAEVDKDTLAKLREAVDGVKEPIFQYDKSYVYDCMEWGPPASARAVPGEGKLVASTSYEGHSEAVYALAYDATHSQLASAGKDSTISLWDSRGRLAQRLQSEQEGCYGGMSMHSSQPVLAAACMGGGAAPHIDIVDVSPGRLNRRQQLQRTSSNLVSCVAFLPGSDLLAIGELLSGSDKGTVSIFDLNHLAEPVATLRDEHGTVTCVGTLDTGTPNPNVVVSGAKDGTITVWDIRSQNPAIHMAVCDPAIDSAMVTTFDSQNCVVMAGSLDHQICYWDVRALQAGTNLPQAAKALDGSAILRIAFGPAAPQAAVSTMGGLYYMDPFQDGVQPSSKQASPFADKETQNYPDVRWGKGSDADALYAASLNGSIDVYRLG